MLGDRAQPGEQPEEEPGLDGVGDRLTQVHDHARGLGVGAGVEEQTDRLDGATALDELDREVGGGHRLDRGRPERVRRGQVETAREVSPQRHAGGERPFDEPWPSEPIEEPAIDARRPGEQADDRVVASAEMLRGRRVGGAHHPRGEGDRIGSRLPHRLVEGGGDDAHAAVRRLDDSGGNRGRPVRRVVDDLWRGDRQRGGVDDQPVDQLGDLVDRVGQDPPGDDQSQRLGLLDPVDEPVDGVDVEQVGVVDDHRVEVGRDDGLGEGTELAAQAQHADGRSLAEEP